jgi:phosphoribosyl 1,2-cyclic phosphate phosphodiesterase
MRVNGYRIGPFAYCTDCNELTSLARERLAGVEILVLDALRYAPHPTHLTLDEAVAIARELRVPRVFLTHIAHDVLHARADRELPDGIKLAYDGLEFNLSACE